MPRHKPRAHSSSRSDVDNTRRALHVLGVSTLFTIGHSTRTIEELVLMLRTARVVELWDVRRYPGSRRHPQFNKDALTASLLEAGIRYEHAVALGGRRHGSADSPNRAWTNAAFRAYADHMASVEFSAAFERLLAQAEREPTAVMCAEALPQRCHRRLIADNAVARGWQVIHLLSPERIETHELHPGARLCSDGRLIYPGLARADALE